MDRAGRRTNPKGIRTYFRAFGWRSGEVSTAVLDVAGSWTGPYLLGAHEPYPAMVVDGRVNVVDANGAAVALFGPDLVGCNLIRRYTHDAARAAIANWADVARAGLARVRDRARQAPHDDELADLVTLAEAEAFFRGAR